MTGRTDLDELLRIMPDDHGADERVDWSAAEAHLGTSLPSDYQAFMAVYGGGAVDNLVILPPLPTGNGWSGSISEHTRQLRDLWANDGGVPGVPPGADAVLPWGTGCNGNELGWLMTGPAPDLWPVVVWRRHESPRWALFECRMTEFIHRLMTADFDKCPSQ